MIIQTDPKCLVGTVVCLLLQILQDNIGQEDNLLV